MSRPEYEVRLDDQNDFVVTTTKGEEKVYVIPFFFLDYLDGRLPFVLDAVKTYALERDLTANKIRGTIAG